MSFRIEMVSRLSGATPSQLDHWRRDGLLVPEISRERPPLYSFRDLILARSLAFLRARVSNQKITRAVWNIRDMPLTYEHLSQLRFGSDKSTIFIGTEDGEVMDVLRKPGQLEVFTFEDLVKQFENFKGAEVSDFKHPRTHLTVDYERLGGWPTIRSTRIPYDVISDFLDEDEDNIQEIEEWYPGVSVDAARDAQQFARELEAI